MTLQEAVQVVDDHHQKYKLSCSPSIIEILLKLESRVRPDYYSQQETHKDKNVGLDFARDKTIEGMTFHRHNTQTHGSFTSKIQDELNAGRFVGVYALNEGSTIEYHGWVVVGIQGGELLLLSKYSELGNQEGHQTVELRLPISDAVPPKMTDLVFYTIPCVASV